MSIRKKHSALYYIQSVTEQILAHPNNRDHKLSALLRSVYWQVRKRLLNKPWDLPIYDKFVIRCYPDSNSASNIVYFGEYYDRTSMTFLRRYLRPGDCFIDAGANIGTYSLLAAGLVGPTGRIIAFEPSPLQAQRLRENVFLNNLHSIVQINQVALSNHEGSVDFLQGYDVSNRISSGGTNPDQHTIAVSSNALDNMLSIDSPIAAMKLDVEGAEYMVLKGAAQHLAASNPPVILFEAMEHLLNRQGATISHLMSLFAEYRYEICSYDDIQNRICPVYSGRYPSNMLAIARRKKTHVVFRLNDPAHA